MNQSSSYHEPVLLAETIETLALRIDGVYVDATLGGGGHFREICARLGRWGVAVGIDRDPDAVEWNRTHMPRTDATVVLAQAPFSRLGSVLSAKGIGPVDGVLADLGVSSHQIDDRRRGFSYLEDYSLDMRMDPAAPQNAADLIAASDARELARILGEYGEVGNPDRMARAIKRSSAVRPLRTAGDLKLCLLDEYGRVPQNKVLAKVFQALRIAVNDELGELERLLAGAAEVLRTGGRLAVIAYHSLEDRLVKNFFRDQERGCVCPVSVPVCTCGNTARFKRITRHAIRPSSAEVERNPRCRSARLRVAQRV